MPNPITTQNSIYLLLKRISRSFGYNLVLVRTRAKAAGYEPILPESSYAPWSTDAEFKKAFKEIKSQTLVDKYRCYELWQLVAEAAKLKGALIEVGTWRGGTGALIAKKARLEGIKDRVYLCDTFAGVVKAGKHDADYAGGEHANAAKKDVERLVSGMGIDDVIILEGTFPDKTGNRVKDKKFRLCHIDVDVYQSSKDIVEWVWPRLVVGGIVVFDDYGFQTTGGVTMLVNEEREKQDRLVIHNLNGHAIMMKLK